MRVAVLMAVQPDSQPSARKLERKARLLCEVLERDERHLRRRAQRHAKLPADADALKFEEDPARCAREVVGFLGSV
ncbi:MAG: hypothetical protein ACREON_19445 [Gemmatimonadaceae bacterium]